MIKKSLKDLSWDVPEEEYRKDTALSYSKLSQFFKHGPKALISTEKVDSPALRFGSLVDCILTAPEEFDDRFYIADIDSVGDKIRAGVERAYSGNKDFDKLEDIPNLMDYIEAEDWQSNWKEETRKRKFIEGGADYFTVLKYSESKTIVNKSEFEKAQQCVMTLKTHPFTYHIFDCNEDEEIFYQLKFKTTLEEADNVPVRIMTDIIKVNHKEKWIQPYDLKTTGKDEELFEESFITWNYWIQSGLYYEVLNKITYEDDFFKDYDLKEFKFIVINKDNLCPLVWDVFNRRRIAVSILSKFGVKWETLLSDANWHLQNRKFDYSRRSYEGNGTNIIHIKK